MPKMTGVLLLLFGSVLDLRILPKSQRSCRSQVRYFDNHPEATHLVFFISVSKPYLGVGSIIVYPSLSFLLNLLFNRSQVLLGAKELDKRFLKNITVGWSPSDNWVRRFYSIYSWLGTNRPPATFCESLKVRENKFWFFKNRIRRERSSSDLRMKIFEKYGR